MAKDIVLDILGWGVPPEFFLLCGLSREIVYYIFYELNLRLPANLDVTGLSPFNPASRTTPDHGPFPSNTKPSVVSGSSTPLSAAATPFVPGSSDTAQSVATDLNGMQESLRAELIARKKVMASRKLKQQATLPDVQPPTAPVASTSNDTSAGFELPSSKTVDDFLNSIGPVIPVANGTTAPAPLPPSRTPSYEDMNVDDIPGLSSATTDYTPLTRPPPQRSMSISSSVASPRPSLASITSATSALPPPSTLAAVTGSLPYDDDSVTVTNMDTSEVPANAQSTSFRRPPKRPVAADFVDMDAGPSRVHAREHPERPTRRRKMNSFANITQKRCILELSDGEDDHDDSTPSSDLPSRTDSRGPIAGTSVPTPSANTPTPPTLSLSALEAKEAEIRRMKEAIAKREQDRLRKLVIVSFVILHVVAVLSLHQMSRSSDGPTANIEVKEEEDEAMAAQSLYASRSSSSSTPGPSNAEERCVAALLTRGKPIALTVVPFVLNLR